MAAVVAPNVVPALSRRRGWILVAMATLTMAISYFDRQTMSLLAPTVCEKLQISDSSYGDLTSAFSIAYLLATPFAGRMLDKIGVRHGLLGAVIVWSMVSAAHALVPGFGTLFALRLALGVAESPSFPAGTQIVYRALPAAERSRGIGVLFTGSSLGAMATPFIATALYNWLGWRGAFAGSALIGLVWIPLWFATAYARGARAALDTPMRDGGLRIAPLTMLRHPAVLRAAAVVVASAPMIGFLLLWSSKMLVDSMHVRQEDVMRYLWVPPVLFDIGAVAFGDLATRQRRKQRASDDTPPRLLLGAALLLAAAIGAIPLVHGPWPTVIVAGVAMAGGGGLFALLTADMLARVPPSAVSLCGGLTAAAQSVAYIIAGLIIGRVVDATHSYSYVLVGLAVWLFPGCLLWLIWKAPPRYVEVVAAS